MDGGACILINGTWVVDYYGDNVDFGYYVGNFPSLFGGNSATWADSHMWSVPADLKSRDPAKYDAVMKLNKFMWDNSINWSRTGHMSYRASVIASDDEINELEKDIDQKGIRIIMLYQPVASDLRLVTSIMKVSPNLERIGDQSVGIAKRARKMNKNPECPESSLTQPLHDLALSQLENAYLAFKNRDVDLALEVKKKDKDLNLICKELAKKLTKKMESDASRIKDYLDLHYIARSLERIGDYSKNICEDAIFLESAVDIRHGGELPESENS